MTLTPARRRGHAARTPSGLALPAVVVALALLTACTTDTAGVALPPSAPVVEVGVDEDGVLTAGTVPAGRVVIRISNRGERPHQLSLLSLALESPPVEEQLRDPPEDGPQLLAQVPLLDPGETGMFAAWLREGRRYALADLSEGPNGDLYAEHGVATEFRASVGDDS